MKKLLEDNVNLNQFAGFSDLLSVLVVVLVLLISFILLSFQTDIEAITARMTGEQKNWQSEIDKYRAKYKREVALNDSLTNLLKERDEEVITLRDLNDKVFFSPGDATIAQDFFPILDRALDNIIDSLATKKYNFVQVVGHTDNTPISNYKYADNWDLGAARATAVVRYFTAPNRRRQIKNNQIVALSYGEFNPSNYGNSTQAKEQNRRIEIVLMNK